MENLNLRLRRWTVSSLINLPLKLKNNDKNKQFVIIGILAAKMVKTSKNNNKYLLIKIDDFMASISCFIFDKDIIERFYKISVGTVILIANPQIINNNNNKMKNNKIKNNINNYNDIDISLKIEDFEQILIIGKSIDFGFCNKSINNGVNKCQNIVNKTKHDLCQFHAAQQYKKYASKRNDTNRSSLSSKLRNRNKKQNLSKIRMNNGISMLQMKKQKNNNNKIINRNLGNTNYRKKRIHPIHSRNKNALQIKQDNQKKKKIK